MGQVTLTGTLTAGPSGGVSAGSFPSASVSAQFGLRVEPSQYAAATGVLQFSIDSAGAYVALGGIASALGPVKRATLLYLRAPSALMLRLTTDDGLGGSDAIELPHQGLLVKEWPDDKALLLVEAKGVGMLEYFACGPA